jgi:hypothetical protein
MALSGRSEDYERQPHDRSRTHENSAMTAVMDGRIEEAQAFAILTLASAVNRTGDS